MSKKIFLVGALLGCMVQVNAQGIVKKIMANLYGGPKIEANASNFLFSDIDGAKSKLNIGGAVGGFLGVRMSEHFAIQEDFLVYYRASQFQRTGTPEGDFKNIGAEMTFYAMGNWQLGNGRIQLGAGPFADYGINAKYKVDGNETDLYEKDNDGKTPLKRLNAGVGATIGYEFGCGLQINASYKLGLLNALDAQKDNATFRPSIISLGLAYRLGK